MEKKLQTELPWIMEIQKFYLTHPVVTSPALILFSKDLNAQSSQHPPPSHTNPQRRKNDPLGVIFGLCFKAVVNYTAVAPLERVKLLLQTQNEQIRSGRLSHPYRGIKDCLLRTIKHEGFLSLWRGNMTNVALRFHSQVVKMGILTCLPTNASPKRNEQGPKNVYAKSIALSFVIASIQHFLLYPLDFGRTRLACDVKQAHGGWKFTTLIDTYQKMLKSNGIAGLYRGYSMAVCGDLAALSILLSRSKTKSPEQDNRQTAVYVHVNAAVVFKTTTYLVLYPFDTVCRRMMMTTGEDSKYAGAADALRQIVKREGPLSLYKGMGALLLRDSAAFLLYRTVIKLLSSTSSKRD